MQDAQTSGTGKRHLVRDSAASGNSSSIAWLAHQLNALARDDGPVFGTVIVAAERRVLDE